MTHTAENATRKTVTYTREGQPVTFVNISWGADFTATRFDGILTYDQAVNRAVAEFSRLGQGERVTCPACKGHGEYPTRCDAFGAWDTEPCDFCQTTGEVDADDADYYHQMADGL